MSNAPASIAFIGLGSNLGDRRERLRAAVTALRALHGGRILARSSVYESPALTLPAAAAQPAYLNAAVSLETPLAPRTLLNELLQIERTQGRDRSSTQRWASRTLDLDILLIDERIINEPGLTIPHPALYERLFALCPLAEIAPAQRHPQLGRTMAELRDTLLSRAMSGDTPKLAGEL